MNFKSFLSAVGHDFLNVFKWLGSSQGQATVAGVETVTATVAMAINPAVGATITGVEAIINAALKQILSMEASAAAVGAQSGTGAQKASAVIASLTPQTAALLQSMGISNATSAEVATLATAISNGLTGILNAIPAAPAA